MTERRNVKLRGGWLPTPEHLKCDLTPHLNAITVPSSVNNYSFVKYWGMLANDQWGDCTCAGDGHIVCQQSAATGTELRPNDTEAIWCYEHSGFDPGAGPPGENPTDQGWTVQAALDLLKNTGWPGVGNWKIAAYGSVDPSNHAAIKQAVFEFGGLSIGFSVPESAMEQFNNHKPWTVVPGSPIEGGHCVIVVGYDANWVYVVTWGAVQKMSWGFWNKYVSEAHAYISKDWVSKTGLSLTAYGNEFSAMFGGGNPFSQPKPKPWWQFWSPRNG